MVISRNSQPDHFISKVLIYIMHILLRGVGGGNEDNLLQAELLPCGFRYYQMSNMYGIK